ncbi:MAG: GlsB/YeaQ/YmgE family stress response membrane protein [Anaerolineales bacterium]|nr:GlsB/YeaQ/YmgE family stress response membrane protein [Anaerolineales bacterium]
MNLFDLFLWILFGALAGWIASIITGKNRQMGALANIVSGIAGAFIGGFLMEFLFDKPSVTGLNLYSLLVSIGGAVVFIWVVGLISGKRRRRRK